MSLKCLDHKSTYDEFDIILDRRSGETGIDFTRAYILSQEINGVLMITNISTPANRFV